MLKNAKSWKLYFQKFLVVSGAQWCILLAENVGILTLEDSRNDYPISQHKE